MGLLRRKQGKMATVAAMSRFSEPDRERGLDMLEVTEAVFVKLGAPSRLGAAIVGGSLAGAGIDESDSTVYGITAGVALMGYACRMADPGRDLPGAMAGQLRRSMSFDESGALDYNVMAETPERLRALLEAVHSLADDQPATVAALAGCSEGAWDAFATMATHQLHNNLVRNGVPKRLLPPEETVDHLLRLGYCVRLIDEVAGQDPLGKDGEAVEASDRPRRTGGASSAERVELDTEPWTSESASVCTHEFEPFAERLIEAGTLDVLGVESFREIPVGGADVLTVANTRFGYALRNRECQLVPGSDVETDGDPIAAGLDERDGPYALNSAALIRLVCDVIDYGFYGGIEALFAEMPGATDRARRAAFDAWADRYPSDEPYVGRADTVRLMQFGYLLHRVFEVRPDRLED